ncbi:hypothetical protein [Helicobacter ailurogastricus]|uniref:Uncharacterized protein n=1 Tax=Helicobacter ailurogastricus TaxID=1578720 RepID=A0A0K2Y3V1_9HELI|nr:hypothetical protein [Helicobacter ailurogastricus]BDQ28470.1 hypothetical protein ASB7_03070 [Helicobacter ailurogastricus]CRF53002.1 hypothetical protein HAL07_14670 [Helicobacter ailurogastricus]
MEQDLEQLYMSRYAKDLAFENLVKNFIFFIVFVVIAMVSVGLWLYPKIDDYRSQDADARQQATIVAYQRRGFVGILQSYRSLKEHNSHLLQPPDYSALINALKILLNQHFTHIKIREESSRTDPLGHFIRKKLRVSAHARNLKDFYAFFDDLVRISAHVQIEFPITITKNENAFLLDFGVHVDHGSVGH